MTYLAVTATGQYSIYQAVPDYLFVCVSIVAPDIFKQLQVNIKQYTNLRQETVNITFKTAAIVDL